MQTYLRLIAKGAESNVYLVEWYGKKSISKIRIPKSYRQRKLDEYLREKRTIHEANMISNVKQLDLITPFIYLVDPKKAEIVMEYVEGKNVSQVIDKDLCFEIGMYASILHTNNIIHGDLTPSNFIINKTITMIDLGLSFFSSRIEDKATDIRLIKEIFESIHSTKFSEFYSSFIEGYSLSNIEFQKIMNSVDAIDTRRRYAEFRG